jgi:hypothetical protein
MKGRVSAGSRRQETLRWGPQGRKGATVRFVFGVFFVLHGLVHLLYSGQSRGLFELRPGMTWPEGSWALSRLLGEKATKSVAGIACGVAALGFVAAGVALLFGQAWWRPAVVGAAAFSSLIFLLAWNGRGQNLADQGAIAILINIAILVAVLMAHWPHFDF